MTGLARSIGEDWHAVRRDRGLVLWADSRGI